MFTLLRQKLYEFAVDQDAFFNGNSVSSFVPAPVAPVTQQRQRQGRNNGGGRRNGRRNGRRRNGSRRRNGRQFQQVSNSFVL